MATAMISGNQVGCRGRAGPLCKAPDTRGALSCDLGHRVLTGCTWAGGWRQEAWGPASGERCRFCPGLGILLTRTARAGGTGGPESLHQEPVGAQDGAAGKDDQTRSQRRWPECVRTLGPSRSAPVPAPSQRTEQPVVKPGSQLRRRLRVSGWGPTRGLGPKPQRARQVPLLFQSRAGRLESSRNSKWPGLGSGESG